MLQHISRTVSSKTKWRRESVTLEIRNKKLIMDGYVIGDEERLLSIFEKANKYDELKAETNFEKEASQ